MKTGELINRIKDDPEILNQLLHPQGCLISEIDIKDLIIEVMPSGFPSLDEYMLLKRGRSELVIVGGRTSHGKSAFMAQLALNVSHYTPVHFFALEMTKEQIFTRLISGIINRPIGAIQRGLVDEKELQKAKQILDKTNIIVDDESGLNVAQIADRVRAWKKRKGTGLVVIDYLQIIRMDEHNSRATSIGNTTKELRALAKEIKTPIIVGSQLNRQSEIRGRSSGDFRPVLSDLSESGQIEMDADVAVMVHRESRYNGLRTDEADILILKNRNGLCGEIVMKYIPHQTKFEDVGDTGI